MFRSKRADRIEIPVWDGTGLVLIAKRLEGAAFAWPKLADGVMRPSPARFSARFEGLDWRGVRGLTRDEAAAGGLSATERLRMGMRARPVARRRALMGP